MSSAIYGALARLLQEQLEAASRLNALLDQEQNALTQVDPTTVETLTVDKQQHLEQLEDWERRRLQLLASAGYAPGNPGMTAFLHANDPDGVLSAKWEELLTLVRACRDRNRRNGGILEMSRIRIQQALDILRGQLPGGSGYGPKGKPLGHNQRRSIAKA
ncbi:MAG: flagella synthesis protein FlgN [Gammaproteobacteria bacterium]